MSIWYEIKDPGDIELDGDELNVLYNSDNQGNYYVAIPIKFLTKYAKVIELETSKDNNLTHCSKCGKLKKTKKGVNV